MNAASTTTPAFALVSPDHRFLAVSQSFADLVGYSPAELCGQTFARITHPADVSIDVQLAGDTFAGAMDGYEIAKRYLHKQGHVVRVLLTIGVVRNAAGAISHGIAYARSLGGQAPRTFPQVQHDHEPNDQIAKIKRAMFA